MNLIKKSIIGLLCLSIFISCSNIASVTEQKTEDKIGVNVSGGTLSFGTVLPEEYVNMFGLNRNSDDGKTIFYSTPEIVTYKVWTENTANRSIRFDATVCKTDSGISFYFSTPVKPDGFYDIFAEAYDSSGKVVMTAKQLNYEISEKNPVMNAHLQFQVSRNGYGKVKIDYCFPFEGKCAINNVTLKQFSDDCDPNDYFTVSDIENGHCTVCSGKTKGVPSDIRSGTYSFFVCFDYTVDGDSYYRFSIADAVNVADNLLSDKIVCSGTPYDYFDSENNRYAITENVIKRYASAYYYLDSQSSSEDESGTYYCPYKKLSSVLKAVNYNVLDSNKFTIYVSSNHVEDITTTLVLPANITIDIISSTENSVGPLIKRGFSDGPMIEIPEGLTLQLQKLIVDGNKSVYSSCGYPAIEIKQGGTLKFESGVIRNNKNTSGNGGGILNNGNCIISGGKFSGNESAKGKAVYFNSGVVQLEQNAELCSADDVNDIYLANGNMITFPNSKFTSNCAAYLNVPEYKLDTPVVNMSTSYFEDNCRKIKFTEKFYGIKNYKNKYGVLDLSVFVAGKNSQYYTSSGSDGSADKPFATLSQALETLKNKTFNIYIDGTVDENSQIKFDSNYKNQSIGLYPWGSTSSPKIYSALSTKNVPLIYVTDSVNLTFQKIIIDANNSELSVYPDKGGCVSIYSNDNSIVFDNVTFMNGKAASAGGAIYINGKNFNSKKLSVSFINGCSVKGNSLTGSSVKGCGIFAEGKSQVAISPYQSSISFSNNTSSASVCKGKNFCYDSNSVELITDHSVKNKKNKETSDGWYRIY